MYASLEDELFKQVIILILREVFHSSLVEIDQGYADLKVGPQDKLDKFLSLDCLA